MTDVPEPDPYEVPEDWEEQELARLIEEQERDLEAAYEVSPENVQYMINTTQGSIDELIELRKTEGISSADEEKLRRLTQERAALYELLESMGDERSN